MAERIGASLTNLKLRELLRRESTRDALRGFFNRRYMAEALDRELSTRLRAGRPLAVLMLDIDHFKRFNDSFGHGVGDTLLRQVAEYLVASTRAQDVVCRYGGEEMIVILPDTSAEDALAVAEKLRAGIRAIEVEGLGETTGPVTVSIGVAVCPSAGTEPTALLHAADAALYRAKGAGRDQVELANT